MASHRPGPPIEFNPLGDGQWSATAHAPDGPVTAIGESPGEALAALDQLLVLARAVEVTRRHNGGR